MLAALTARQAAVVALVEAGHSLPEWSAAQSALFEELCITKVPQNEQYDFRMFNSFFPAIIIILTHVNYFI